MIARALQMLFAFDFDFIQRCKQLIRSGAT
jgi:hypothetical protein